MKSAVGLKKANAEAAPQLKGGGRNAGGKCFPRYALDFPLHPVQRTSIEMVKPGTSPTKTFIQPNLMSEPTW